MAASNHCVWPRALVFDLDDTLYPELTYVASGFRTVATALAARYALDAGALEVALLEELSVHGRGAVFDAVLERHGLLSGARVGECVALYRQHRPRVSLFPDAAQCLRRFAGLPCYVVTDGHKGVQSKKVAALGLNDLVRDVLITHRFGRNRAKPSAYCLLRVCDRERLEPADVLFVGDDPTKDFVGIRPLGFRTVRVRRGRQVGLRLGAAHEAEVEIESLAELTSAFLESLRVKTSRRPRLRAGRP